MPAFGDPSNDPNWKPMPGDHARDSTRGGKIYPKVTPTTRPTGKQYADLERLLASPNKPQRRMTVGAVLFWIVALVVAVFAFRHFT